jgi:hypothetical protein
LLLSLLTLSSRSATPDDPIISPLDAAAAAAASAFSTTVWQPSSHCYLHHVLFLLCCVCFICSATPDGPITSPLDAAAASSNRDALVKVMYSRVFDWLVSRINASIGQDPAAFASIGLLDIYGFESFTFNDLEQVGGKVWACMSV